MKLYIFTASPNCRKVMAVINHLGLNVDVQTLVPFGEELKSDDYLTINPNAKVPALVDGDFNLWECTAIMQYLASKVADNDLYPSDAKVRADIMRWQSWDQAHFGKAMGAMAWENFAKPAFKLGETDLAVVEQAVEEFHRYAPVLEQQLDTNQFVIGENITLADYSLAAILMYAVPGKVPLESYSNIRSWYERVEQIPAWQKSSPEELEKLYS